MRLTTYTDYALRILIHLGSHRDRLVTIDEITALHAISKNHLTKVVHQLGLLGVIDTVRGRNGGLRLNRAPDQINIGAVVRSTEPDFIMAECFDPRGTTCALRRDCGLRGVLIDATSAFLQVLDGKTLADLLSTTTPAEAPLLFRQPAKT